MTASPAATAWQYLHPGQQATDVVLVDSGDAISGGSVSGLQDELVVVKHSGDGSEVWRYTILSEPADRREVLLAHDPIGAVFAAGRYEQGRGGPFVGQVVKLLVQDGTELWSSSLPTIGIYDLSLDASGELL